MKSTCIRKSRLFHYFSLKVWNCMWCPHWRNLPLPHSYRAWKNKCGPPSLFMNYCNSAFPFTELVYTLMNYVELDWPRPFGISLGLLWLEGWESRAFLLRDHSVQSDSQTNDSYDSMQSCDHEDQWTKIIVLTQDRQHCINIPKTFWLRVYFKPLNKNIKLLQLIQCKTFLLNHFNWTEL